MVDLSDRLSNIEKLERELLARSRNSIRPGASFGFVTLFVFGAVKRTLAQSQGFRTMILESNFPSAAILLRLQTQSNPECDEDCQSDCGQEVSCEFVIASCHASEVFEATEGIFDKVAILVTPLIISD